MLKFNVGCGENYLEGYVNLDLQKPGDVLSSKKSPDLFLDISKDKLPFEPASCIEILCSHNIEHISYVNWPHVFFEFQRVLAPGGMLLLTYPEFEVCARYFLENHKGMRDFWRMTLFGRQLWPGDHHVSPVHSPELAWHLRRSGFTDIFWTPEPHEPQYTVMRGIRSEKKVRTREDLLRESFTDRDPAEFFEK